MSALAFVLLVIVVLALITILGQLLMAAFITLRNIYLVMYALWYDHYKNKS